MNKKTIRIVVSIIGIISIGIAGFLYISSLRDNSNPSEIVQRFMVSVRHERYDEARKYLTPDASNLYDETAFRRFRSFFNDLGGATNPIKESTIIIGDRATEEIKRTTFGTGVVEIKIAYLRKTFWGWKIEAID